MGLITRKLFRLRVSQTSAISTATTIAKLIENLSEAVNFVPTKGAAKIVQQILETVREVGDNSDKCLQLLNRVVVLLLSIREHYDSSHTYDLSRLNQELKEFDDKLVQIRISLQTMRKKSLACRTMSREKIKGDLADLVATLEQAISKLSLYLQLRTNACVESISQHVVHTHELLLRTNACVETIAHRVGEQHGRDFEALLPTPADKLLTTQSAMVRNDAFLADLTQRGEYRELATYEIQLINPEPKTVTFSNLSYARINGETKLVKSFDGDDAEQKEVWLREVKRWHRLKHPNLLQLYGFSKKTSPHLFVVFQNAQARCLATYMLDAFTTLDIPSIVAIIVKMINQAQYCDAIKHTERQFRLNEASSAAVAEEAMLALDSEDNLIVSIAPPKSGGGARHALIDTLYGLFFPPVRRRKMNCYFERLSASGHSFALPPTAATGLRQTMAAVQACMNEGSPEAEGGLILNATGEKLRQATLTLSMYIDHGCEVRAGDYGILVTGQEEEFSFQAFGNVVDDSYGIISASHDSDVFNFMSRRVAAKVQGFPLIWSLDLNEDRLRGYSQIVFGWRCFQRLADVPRAMEFLTSRVPFLEHDDGFENLILITLVRDNKDCSLSFQGMAQTEPFNEKAPETSTSDGLLPIVYVTEPSSQEHDLHISQCRPGACAPMCRCWDSRVSFEGERRQRKWIHYVQFKKKDIIM